VVAAASTVLAEMGAGATDGDAGERSEDGCSGLLQEADMTADPADGQPGPSRSSGGAGMHTVS
jgi:hypothetical protein